jgi:hypothetical protein
MGRKAGENNKTGSNNSFFGFNAGAQSIAGTANVYVGSYAGIGQTGSNNISLGAYSAGLSPVGNNQLSIGNTIFGDLATRTIQIGSGTLSGTDRLKVEGSVLATQFKLSALHAPPANSSAACSAGEIRVTQDSIYVCIAANMWRKATLASF